MRQEVLDAIRNGSVCTPLAEDLDVVRVLIHVEVVIEGIPGGNCQER